MEVVPDEVVQRFHPFPSDLRLKSSALENFSLLYPFSHVNSRFDVSHPGHNSFEFPSFFPDGQFVRDLPFSRFLVVAVPRSRMLSNRCDKDNIDKIGVLKTYRRLSVRWN